MKTKIYDARASQDVTIDELPKQDSPNNSDLVIVQSSSLTEATSIQQLRNKILGGAGGTISEDLGTYIYSATRINNNNYLLMDGTQYSKLEYPDFYLWLTTKSEDIKLTFTLDTIAETFRLPNYKDTVPFIANEDGNFYNILDRYVLGRSPDLLLGNSPVYCYIKVKFEYTSGFITSPYIKSDGTVAMDLEYNPTDPLDVATKKYIDNKFLNYEIPLSFSINDIGKRVPYYKNADQNPTLIALDGTKYLIADYPDFDYTQEGFTNDGVYFWCNHLSLEILPLISSSGNVDIEVNGYIRFSLAIYPITFNSKLVYNFLQTTEGQKLLVADGVGKDKDNFGFTILDANTYQIRMNTNQNFLYRIITSGFSAQNPDIVGALNITPITGNHGVTEGRYLLKIQPDYMVAKIQQLGSATGTGDLKSDRSVLLTGVGTFNTKQIVAMDDLKDSNIIVTTGARALVTLDTKLNNIDTDLVNLNTDVAAINNNIGNIDITNLQSQVNTNTIDITNIKTINTNQDSSITTLQNQVATNTTDITNLQNNMAIKRKTLFNRKFSVNTAGTIIKNNGTIRLLDLLTNNGTNINGFESNNNSYIFTSGTNAFIQEKILYSDLIDSSFTITVRFKRNGAFGNTTLDFQLLRVIDNSVVEGVSENNTSSTAQEFSMKINTTLYGLNDPYVLNGYYFRITNRAGTDFAYDSIELKITRTMDYGY